MIDFSSFRSPAITAAVIVGLLGAPVHIVGGQGATPQFKTQVIGLRHLSVAQLNDSLVKRFGPSEGLDSHSCGANLADLGFPRTSAIVYQDSAKQARFVVAVVEPQDSARVRYISIPATSAPLPDAWNGEALLKQFLDPSGRWLLSNQFTAVLMAYPMVARGQLDSARRDIADSKATAQHEVLWTFLRERTSADDRAQALRILANDSSYKHRMLALAVLANASDDTQMWYTMLRTFRDPNDNVAMLAADILKGWTTARTEPVDWAPAAEDLRVLLAGGNLWTLPQLFQILDKTQVSPALAKQLLADNGTFIVGYAGTHGIEKYAKPARSVLARLSGHDYGNDVVAWNRWIATL